jgi:hypothetical protein
MTDTNNDNLAEEIQDDQAIDQQDVDNQTTEGQAQDVDKPTDRHDSDDGKGAYQKTIDWIKQKKDEILGKEGSGDKTGTDGATDLSGTDIPREFSDLAEALGWSVDDIEEFAGHGNNGKPYTDEELLAMVPELTGILEEQDSKSTDKQDTDNKDGKQDDTSKTDDPNVQLRKELKQEILKELGVESVQ